MINKSKLQTKIIIIAALILTIVLASIQPVRSLIDADKITASITNSLKPEIENTIKTALNNTLEPYTEKLDGYINQTSSYQKQLNQVSSTLEQVVNDSVDGISEQVKGEINKISEQVQTAISNSIRTAGWSILIGDIISSGIVTAFVTWWIVRRINKQLEKQVNELNQTIAKIQSRIETSVDSVTQDVRNQLDINNTNVTG